MPYAARVHVIACGVLALDIRRAAEMSGISVTSEYLEGGLHARPLELRARLQEAVDRASEAQNCDRIAIGYGICGGGTIGLHARGVPLVIPKVHDCIALFLGSDAAYKKQFRMFPGTYYVSAGWFEEKVEPLSQSKSVGVERAELAEKYGGQNADAIIRFLSSWQRNYRRAVFIDTGVGEKLRYADYAKAMAREFGWKYERLPGDVTLLVRMLTAKRTTAEVLYVPPWNITRMDAIEGALKAGPEKRSDAAPSARTRKRRARTAEKKRPEESGARMGLGIDAGGTFTDAVLYDFGADRVVGKAKAPTTRWDYTVGIENALAALDGRLLKKVELVAVSTTLATNAIVEGRGRKVGLLLMPPYGLFDAGEIAHEPKATVSAQLEIDGSERVPVDADQVRRIAREMVEKKGVRAFAVSGFAGTVNPAHELELKRILREQTGLGVTCGHELSQMLNFRTRAVTAVLNARIIPHIEKFLADVRRSLRRRSIDAVVMVVKGDGTLMSDATARERPVETVFSGPAASVAGTRFLTKAEDAIVVDIGGTTTDTGTLVGGAVHTCAQGAVVGGRQTHVQALEMRTIALGADSLVSIKKGELHLGPRRVAPVAYLASGRPGTFEALAYAERRLDEFTESTQGLELLTLNEERTDFEPTEGEKRIIDALERRPFTAAELAQEVGAFHWSTLRLKRLEEEEVVQRCGFTPTDALHVLGRFERWDAAAAEAYCRIIASVSGRDPVRLCEEIFSRVVRLLAEELLKNALGKETDPEAMDRCPVCRALVENLFAGGNGSFALKIDFARPVVGIGAPAHVFLPPAGEILNARVVIPPDADVANAIGAVTSSVVISRIASVRPNEEGGYTVSGLSTIHNFADFTEACDFAADELAGTVRDLARLAGADSDDVELSFDDRSSRCADGSEIFIERTITARITGRPRVTPAAEVSS